MLPAFDAATIQNIRTLVSQGAARGNAHDVFAKIGDSITESASFLFDAGFGWENLGTYTSLQTDVSYFSAHALPNGTNSFNRQSLSATAGWTTDDALAGGASSPLQTELNAIHPQWAIVMYGTNDMDKSTLAQFTTNMNTIVDIIEQHGAVPILSTVPNRHDTTRAAGLVPQFNDAIRNIAATRHVPLIDYNVALQPLPNNGVGPDGIHPDSYNNNGDIQACDFTSAGLQHGYNMRNLTAIQMLDRLRAY